MRHQSRQSESSDNVIAARDDRACYRAEVIFREMVLGEIQGGRVSRSHHARMLAFAGQIGITHTAAAALISDCCLQAAAGSDPQTRRYAARLASPRANNTLRACVVISVIVIAELVLILVL